MKKKITQLGCSSFNLFILFCAGVLSVLFSDNAHAQTRVYAATAVNVENVENASNATLLDNTYATIKSSGFLFDYYEGELRLSFANSVPANKTTFVKIGLDQGLLNSLLGGNLGSALSTVVGAVVLGNHYFTVKAIDDNNKVVLSGSSSGSFSTSDLKLITDANGNYYLAITPSAAYKTISIRDITRGLLAFNNELRVYNAFHVPNNSSCETAFGTDYEGSGATLSLLGLGGAGVTNIERAIDNDPITNSKMSLGLITVGGTISQNVYFSSPSKVGDEFNVRLKVSPDLLNLGLLSRLTVEAYNGNNLVYTAGNVSTLLNLDLLGLLNSGNAVNVAFSPNANFDRVKITLASLLNVAVVQSIDIYEVTRSAPRPTFAAPVANALNACYNSSASLKATTASANQLLWYDALEGGNLLATTAYNEAYTTALLTSSKIFYVAAKTVGCVSESIRVPVTVTVNPEIVFANTSLAAGMVGLGYSKQLTAPTGGSPGVTGFTYSLMSGGVLPAGISLSSTGLISGVPTQSGSFSFNIEVKDSRGCVTSQAKSLVIRDRLTLTTEDLVDGVVGVVYPGETIPVATGGSGSYTYTATNLPPGLTFDETTRVIIGTPSTVGNYLITITVKDGEGNSVSTNYAIRVKNPLILNIAVLADGVTQEIYAPQIIPAAQGGVTPYTYTATGLPPGLTFNTDTRVISGTPTTAGTYVVNVVVKDASLTVADQNYSIKIVNPLQLPNKLLADATVNMLYSGETLPTAIGGTGPYTYVAQNVPAEILFNDANNSLLGTPNTAGTYSITLTVTDADGRTATNYYNLKVNGSLSLAGKALPDGLINNNYLTQVLPEVTGGVAPYVYTLTGLPAGLTFNGGTRAISGTPTSGGNFTLTLTAKDANGNTVASNYQLKINVGDPVVLSATVCSGNAASLSVSNTQTNVTYNWYGEQGSSSVATNNGTFITPVVTTNTVFYVEAVSGNARSNKVAVTVVVNPAPNAPSVITTNTTANVNQVVTLRALAEAGSTVHWYGQAVGGSRLATGEEFTTPALSASTVYYVEAVSALGCSSSTRTPVSVTILSSTGACNVANAQSSGINGILCVLCNVSNPTFSVDANQDNFTRITLAVGVAATGFQRLIFPSNGFATDSISLDLATPVGLTDLSVLSGITVNVIKNNTIVKTVQLNSSLINLQLLSGNRFTATFLAGAEFDRVEVRFQALVAALSSLDIYGAKIVYPKPTITSQNQTICYNTNATLVAIANGGTQLKWFDAASGGNELNIVSPYNTPNLTANTTYYLEVTRGACASYSRIPVTVNVVPLLAQPTALSNSVTTCANSSAVLGVRNPVVGVTYRWYETSTNGIVLHTGESYSTPNITASKTFYVEAFQNGCVSAQRTAINVNVAPRPIAPQLQASVTTVKAGQTAVLTAQSTESDVDFNWYSSRTASSPLYSGDTFITPPLTANASYYVETVSRVTGCASSSRVMVTVNVDQTVTPSPVACVSPAAEQSGTTGVALLAGVSNGNLAIDNDTETGSTLYLPVGVLNASVYQKLVFAEKSTVGDTLKVLLSSPGKLLSLGLLSSVRISTLDNTVPNNDELQLDNSLIQLELLSGGSQALVTFVPTKVFDRVEIKLVSGVVSALSTVNVNYVRKAVAVPALTSNDVDVCLGSSANLSVSEILPGYTYKWYDKDGIYLASGDTYTTAVISATTKFYVTATTQGGCESAKKAVNVNLLAVPQAPVLVSNSISTCAGGSVVMEVKDPLPGVTYQWYNSANLPVKQGASFTLYGVVSNDTYYVASVSDRCGTASSNVQVALTVGSLSAPIVAASNVNITTNSSAVLYASSSAPNAVIKWYDSSVGGTALATGNSFLTEVLAADKTYYAEASVLAGCTSGRTPITVTVVPNGTPGQVPCNTASSSLDAGSFDLSLLSGVFNPGLAVDDKIETGSSLVVGIGALGAYAFQRVGFDGLSNVGDTVRVHISSPSKLLSLSVLSSLSVSTYNQALPNNDLLAVNASLIKIDLLSDGSAGVISFVPDKRFTAVELRLNTGLASVLTSVNLNYVERRTEAPQVVQTNVSVCVNTVSELSVKNPLPSLTYKWYLENTYVGEGVSYNTPTTLSPGTYSYNVRTFSNGCESASTKVVVSVLSAPSVPVPLTVNPASVCYNSSAVIGVVAAAGLTYNWYDAAGELLVRNNDVYTIPNTLAVGVYDYFVEAINATNCSSSARTNITVKIQKTALAADVQIAGNTTVCGGAAVLTASSSLIVNPIFKWYSDAALTNLKYTGATYSVSGLTENATFYVAVSGDGVCESLPGDGKEVKIVLNPLATASDLTVSQTQEICGPTVLTLTASSTTVQNPVFTWYQNADLTGKLTEGASFTTNELSASTVYYVTVKGDNKCESTSSAARSVAVVFRSLSTAADIATIGASKVCVGGSVALAASSTTVVNPIFTWYADAALANILHVGANFNTGLLTQSTDFYITVKGDNKCETNAANAKKITVTVSEYAEASAITLPSSVELCGAGSTVLSVTSTGVVNPVFTWYSNASLTTVVNTGATFTTPLLTSNQTYYVTVKGDNKCENVQGSAAVVNVVVKKSSLASDLVVVASKTLCGEGTVTLEASSVTVINPIFTWYLDEALTSVAGTGANFVTPTLNATTRFYVTIKGDNKCESAVGEAKMVEVIYKTIALASDLTLTGAQKVCANTSNTLTAKSTTVTNPVYTWYSNAALTTFVHSGETYSPTLTSDKTFYVTVKGDNKCENSAANAASIDVEVFAIPAAPIFETAGTSVCVNNQTTLKIASPLANVIYEWYGAETGGSSIHSGVSFTTATLGASVSYWVQAVGVLGCATPSIRTKVEVTVNTLPAVPTVVASSITICKNASTVLRVENPIVGVDYHWYNVSTGGTVLSTGASYTTALLNANAVYYVEASRGSCRSVARTLVNVQVEDVPSAPASVTATNTQLCAGSGTVLTVNNPEVNISHKWYTVQTGGSSVYEGNVYTVLSLAATTTYYVEAVSKGGGCASVTRTAVTVNVSPVLQAPVVTVGTITHESVEFNWLAVSGAVTYEVSVDGGLNWISTNSTRYVVGGLQRDQYVAILVRAKGVLACETSANSRVVDTRTLAPFKDSLYVPNTFTPNGDGSNDVFYGYGNNVSKCKMRVFNQWGKLVFESNSLNIGWNGTFNGSMQPNGVYVYTFEINYNSGVFKTYKGTVTLLR